MSKEILGSVTEEEKQTIERLYERKNALGELMQTMSSPMFSDEQRNKVYDWIVADLGKTNSEYNKWWSDMGLKYNWKIPCGEKLFVDFNTNGVFVNKLD